MDRSLKGLMLINRLRFFRHILYNIPESPNPPTTIPVTPISNTTYTLSDFGENAINNHSSSDEWHSNYVQELFNYVTRNFRDRCTSYQSYNNPLLGGGLFSSNKVLEYCAKVKADIVMTPYVNAARFEEGEYNNMVISVGSHYDNNNTDGIIDNPDRYDITPNANTFLGHSIAVSSRRDTPAEFKDATSYGYGMEFFEDCSPQGLDIDFPNHDIPTAFAELVTTDGITLTSNIHPTFSSRLSIGRQITIRYTSNESDWITVTVTNINSPNSITVNTPIPLISNRGIYGWFNATLGERVYGQAESCAVPIIAGKLKVIKMTTNKDWETVRHAARMTARRNITGISEIDNTNWDIYIEDLVA